MPEKLTWFVVLEMVMYMDTHSYIYMHICLNNLWWLFLLLLHWLFDLCCVYLFFDHWSSYCRYFDSICVSVTGKWKWPLYDLTKLHNSLRRTNYRIRIFCLKINIFGKLDLIFLYVPNMYIYMVSMIFIYIFPQILYLLTLVYFLCWD